MVIYLLFCLIVMVVQAGADPLVQTRYGPVSGIVQQSRKGRPFEAFKGVPYARPPLGPLRFKAPEPPEPWPTPINATTDAPFCIQKDYYYNTNPQVEGSEDCLYMNIYVPRTNTSLLPVMVYIHGGGFIAGTGNSDIIGPEYLMDRDIVFVTFNYRVGFLGFFSTCDDAAPGNFGFKDQVMALKFVQRNIKFFGGDRKRVTIFGQSAGGSSVSLHLVSPLSRGLFHRAISQSGVALNIFAKPLDNLHRVFTAFLGFFVGCGNYLTNNQKLVDCLRKVDAARFTEMVQKFKYFSVEPIALPAIVIEKQTELNPRPFLTMDPLEIMQSGQFSKVPWMAGVTEDEGIFRVGQLIREPETLNELNSNFHTLLPLMLGLPLSNGDATEALLRDLVNFYLGGKYFIDVTDPKSVQGFINLYSDRTINYGTYQNVMLHAKKGHKPIYVYNFNYRGEYTYGDRFAATSKNINFTWGVSHNDELLYLFRIPARFPDLTNVTDLRISDELLKLWTDFAAYGNPDPDDALGWNTCLNVRQGRSVKNFDMAVLHITGNCTQNTVSYKMEHGFFPARMRFWARLNLKENFPGLD